MPELRKDTVTDTWVIFAEARSRRPEEARVPPARAPPETCPFCPGHEGMTPPEVLAYRETGSRDSPGWRVRCFPNEFPALAAEGVLRRRRRGLFESISGVGAHEVIVESPEHEASLATLGDAQVEDVLRAYRDRALDLRRDRRLKYVLIFENHGERAGASQSHPHAQLLATPLVPRRIREEMEAAGRHARTSRGRCIWCDLVRAELRERIRVVAENDASVAFSPFASRFAFETWILPKAHAAIFEDLPDAGLRPLARIMKDVLSRLRVCLNDPSYNYAVHTAPRGAGGAEHHWHIEVTPRVTEMAGFEVGTGGYINPVLPEEAAAALREERPATGVPR